MQATVVESMKKHSKMQRDTGTIGEMYSLTIRLRYQ